MRRQRGRSQAYFFREQFLVARGGLHIHLWTTVVLWVHKAKWKAAWLCEGATSAALLAKSTIIIVFILFILFILFLLLFSQRVKYVAPDSDVSLLVSALSVYEIS